MAVRRVQLRRGSTNDHTTTNNGFTGAIGEITVDTTTKSIRVHDGETAGGFDLMRADMSNDNFANSDITIAEGVGNRTLTIGAGTTTISIPGNLTVAGTVTQSDSLAIAARLIGINTGANQTALDTDSIGVVFERFNSDLNAGAGTQQDNAFLVWRETGDYFVLGTATGIDESTQADILRDGQVQGQDWEYADLYLKSLVVDSSLDMTDGNITSVAQIQADSLRYADANNKLAIMPEAGLAQADAFSINDGVKTYLTINTSTEDIVFGTVAKKLTINSNDIDLGTDAANDVVIEVAARTGDNDGQDLTIKAGSAADSDDNLGGNLILASGSGVEVGGTSSIQFQTKRTNVAGVSEAMRIHTDGTVGIGTASPSSLLHISGADTSTITLENTTGGNGQDDDASTIQFIGNGQAKALAQIVGAHDGAADDDKGVLIFKPNNDADPTEALRLASDLKATFAGAVEIATSLDLTDGNINNVGTIDLDKITDRENNGIEIEIHNGQAAGLVIDDTDGNNFLTLNADADTITLHQATTLSSTLQVDGGTATIQGIENGSAILYLNADESTEPGDNWRVQAADHATRTLTFAGETNVADAYADVLTLTGANTSAASSATVKGTLIVEGEIQSATDITFQVDNNNDAGVNNKFAFQNGANTEIASLDENGKLTVSGVSDLDGGIDVNASNFTVATTGAIDTKSTLQVDGNVRIGENALGSSPTLTIVEHTGGATKFEVAGASGNTTVGGTLDVSGLTTLSSALQIEQGVANGIVFNSNRTNEDDVDAALILVKDDSDGGSNGVLSWDNGLDSFSFSGSKLNSVLDLTVGTLATPSTTISASNGSISTAGTTPYLVLKNTTDDDANNGDESIIRFQNADGNSLAEIRTDIDGANNTDGKFRIYTRDDTNGLQEAFRLDPALKATFAGAIEVDGNAIKNSGSTDAISFSADNTLTTISATTTALTGDLRVNGNDIQDSAGVASITFSGNSASTTLTATTTILSGDLQVNGTEIDVDVASVLNIGATCATNAITLGASNTPTVVAGHLDVSSVDATTSANITLGTNAAVATKIMGITATGVVGNDLTIEAGGTTFVGDSGSGAGNNAGGDLILKSGSGKGTGTSDIQFFSKIASTDAPTLKMTLKGSGNLGLGEATPTSLLHLSNTSAPTITLQNKTAGDDANDRATVLTFKGQTAGNVVHELANITVSHDTNGATNAGKIVFSTFATADWEAEAVNSVQPVLTLDSTQLATFAGSVQITGNLTVSGDTTTVNTATLDVEDTVIRLNKGIAGEANTNDVGIFFERGTTGNDAIFYWDEVDDFFKLGTTTNVHTATDFGGATTLGGLQLASLILPDNSANALDIKRQDPDSTSMLKFVTTNGSESIVMGAAFTADTGSTVGNLTLSSGSITDSGGTVSFSNNHIDTTGLASLDGGINVLDKFTVSTAGATVVLNTLTLNEATGNLSDFDVQSDGTSVFKVDVSEKDAIVGASSTLFTNKIQATTDANDSLQLYLKDNTALGLVVSNVSDNVDFITVKTTTNSELITLAQATSISETLEVVGNATFDAEVHVETANVNGIFFNQDGDQVVSDDATIITIEGGSNKSDVVLGWDTSDDALNLNAQSSLHLQGVNVGDALTIGGALKANAVASIKTDGTATFTTAKIDELTYSAATDNTLTVSLKDTLANALKVVADAGDEESYLNINTNTATLTIGTDSATSTTLNGISTFTDSIKLTKAVADTGIIFNSNRGAGEDKDGGTYDAILLHVEDGGSNATDAYLKWDDDESSFTIDGGSFHTNSALSVGTAIGAKNFTVSTAGAVSTDSTLSFTTASQGAIVFNSDLGNADAPANDDDFGITVNRGSSTDALFYWDEGLTSWLFNNAGKVQVNNDIVVDSGSANNLVLSAGSITTADNSGIDFGSDALSTSGTLTLTGNTVVFAESSVAIGEAVGANNITLGGATTTVVTAGDLKVGGNDIQDSGNASAITFDGSQNTTLNGNVSIATTKSLTLNSGANGVNTDIIVNRNNGSNGIIRWVELNTRFEVDNGTGSFSPLVSADQTVFTFDADGDANSIAITQDAGKTVTFQGANAGKNRGLDFTISGDSMILSFENDVRMPDSLIVDNILQVDGQLLVDSNDIEFDEANATIGAGTGANTITIGAATSTVAVAGSLVVNGTSIDVDAASALTVGATVGANDLTLGAATSTVVAAGDLKVEGNLVYDSSKLTIANGSITVTKPYHTVEIQVLGDETDDLDTIVAPATAGHVVVLQAFDDTHTVVVKHNTGNLRLAGGADFSLATAQSTISLIYNGTHWCELTRSTNV